MVPPTESPLLVRRTWGIPLDGAGSAVSMAISAWTGRAIPAAFPGCAPCGSAAGRYPGTSGRNAVLSEARKQRSPAHPTATKSAFLSRTPAPLSYWQSATRRQPHDEAPLATTKKFIRHLLDAVESRFTIAGR